MENEVGAVNGNQNAQAAANTQNAADQFAQAINTAVLSLGMKIFNEQQEALGELQQEF